MASDRDHKLGMDRDISRRDFLNGVAATSAAAFLPARLLGLEGTGEYAPEKAIDYNPAALTGMRGSGYPGAFKVGHAMRDGVYWPGAPAPIDTHEEYDLIIVGAGISGLSAAYFYRQAEKAGKRILILDNHDDFGGHAKRNQFEYKGDVRISNAGTFWIEGEYGETSTRLLAELGIDAAKIYKENTNPGFYSSLGMGQGVFFDKETWGQDKLLPDPAPWTDFVAMYEPTVPPDQAERWKKFMAEAPMPEHVKQDLYRLYNDMRDYLPGLTVEQKIEKLSEIKYPEFVTTIAGCDPMVLTYLRDRTFGDGTGLDQLRAIHANGYMPGLQGLNIPHVEDAGTYTHFPDGNATIARLLVRRLIPAALPGTTLEDSILAKVNYAALDVAESPVKIRLNSTVVKVQHVEPAAPFNFGDPAAMRGNWVEVSYSRGGQLYTARARHCILACWNFLIRYICPELPAAQKEALAHNVKTPNLWINVWLRNWQAFHRAKVNFINAPTSYFASIILEQPVTIGGYSHSRTPDDPTVLTMLRGYIRPGLPISEQYRLGRLEMYETTFETFERNLRDQLGRTLGPYGFNPAEDILGITVNRWGHGYARWEETPSPKDVPYMVRGRQPYGRIAIANSDAGGEPLTVVAIDQAFRAVNEVLLA
jgi:spermidine dehydrogenase